jgi:hypothetical protein
MGVDLRLYNCPFCGYPADFRIAPRAAVFCTNLKCGASFEQDGVDAADVKACARKWNDRMDPEPDVTFEWPSRRVFAP